MSSRIFQNVIIQMKDAIDRTIGVVDDQGFIIACSELSMIGSRLDEFHVYEMEASEQPVSIGSRTFCPLLSNGSRFDFTSFVDGSDSVAMTLCAFAAVAYNETNSN